MDSKVAKFYSFTGISEDKDMLNILQIVRPALRQRGYIVLEIPFADEEIGALCYHGDALGYILINTSLSRVNANFAICHEIYHAFYPQNEFESSFRQMYRVFRAQSDNNEMDTLIRLMNYYQVPYMAALVRCYELGLTESGMLTQQLMELDKASIREKIENLWLDSSILDASNKDDYIAVERVVKRMGMEYLQEGYLNERTLRMVLQNMNSLYREIKGEHK